MTKTRAHTNREGRICQGDIFRNIEYIEYAIEKHGQIEISKIVFPYICVLTQDCDLNSDYRVRWSRKDTKDEDKKLISVIVVPLYNAEHVFAGEHLSDIKMTMQKISKSSTTGKKIMDNEIPRYHYFEFSNDIRLVPLIADFKHYFTVNVEYLKKVKKSNFICKIGKLYREDFSQRFSWYLSRIGLPDN